MKNTIFGAADILLPPYPAESKDWEKWSVIACDQFTSEKEYWDKARAFIGNAPSTLDLILPEAFLKTEDEEKQKAHIAEAMKSVGEKTVCHENALIYVERALPGVGVRRGLVGKLDLAKYDFGKGTASAVRPTEATVLDRIPPRKKIRAESDYELPHVMVFSDAGESIVGIAEQNKEKLQKLYDFELMAGGGHLTGWLLAGDVLEQVLSAVEQYEESRSAPGAVVYAVGDGNHSLAAAKAHYEDVKTEKARFALCEIVDISEKAIEFEPIYRIVKGCDVGDLLDALGEVCEEGGQAVKVVWKNGYAEASLSPTHALTVGSLQNFLDGYVAAHPGTECDYIHGEESLVSLAKAEHTVGFLFDGMQKSELFPYVEQNGVLPRKTFSMGNSYSKRYYTELRIIK